MLVENALFATLDATVRKSHDRRSAPVHVHRHRRLRAATCRTSWSRRSARRSRRSATPTSSCTSSTDRIPDPAAQLATVRDVIGEIEARRHSRDRRRSTRPTSWMTTSGWCCAASSRRRSSSRRARARASTSCSTRIAELIPQPEIELTPARPVRPGRPHLGAARGGSRRARPITAKTGTRVTALVHPQQRARRSSRSRRFTLRNTGRCGACARAGGCC